MIMGTTNPSISLMGPTPTLMGPTPTLMGISHCLAGDAPSDGKSIVLGMLLSVGMLLGIGFIAIKARHDEGHIPSY